MEQIKALFPFIAFEFYYSFIISLKKMFVKGIFKYLVDFAENYGAKLCGLADVLCCVSC